MTAALALPVGVGLMYAMPNYALLVAVLAIAFAGWQVYRLVRA